VVLPFSPRKWQETRFLNGIGIWILNIILLGRSFAGNEID
jgi:hypothetical protein